MGNLLNIKNLQVSIGKKQVLRDVSLEVKPGELHVIMGPNGAGKSSLAQVIMGHPDYQVIKGELKFGKQDLVALTPEKRVKLGIALAYQTPPKVEGVKLKTFLNLIKKDSKLELDQIWPDINSFMNKDLNSNLSGGEKKITELLQLVTLQPKLAIFDELDAGLDFENWQKMVQLIKQQFIAKNKAVIFISHQPQLVAELKPDYVHIILDHKLICTSQDYQKILSTIRDYDYDRCRHCPRFTN